MSGLERRAFPRRPFEQPVQAYENGARFPCKPVDLSLGGAFLRTRDLERFRTGELVSVVFAREAGWAEPVYLFARIVRRQENPLGIGLAWERAVTSGDTAYLADFLHATLGLKTDVAARHAQAVTGRFHSVFSFDLVHRAGEAHRRKAADRQAAEEAQAAREAAAAMVAAPASASAAPPAPPEPTVAPERVPTPPPASRTAAERPRATRSIVSRLAESRGVSRRSGDPSNPFDERTPSGQSVGVLTDEIRATDQPVPASLAAALEIDGRVYPATIATLGSSRLTVVAVTAPAHVPGRLRLSTDLPAGDASSRVVADCEVHGFSREVEGTVYHLAVNALDEGDDPGVLLRYVKFLYFQALAGPDA